MGSLEAVEVVEPPGDAAGARPLRLGELVPGHLSPVQQCQLMQLLEVYGDMFSQDEDDIGQTSVVEHTIETQGPPVRLPYYRQNSTVRQEEAEQVQQMPESSIIQPSNSP